MTTDGVTSICVVIPAVLGTKGEPIVDIDLLVEGIITGLQNALRVASDVTTVSKKVLYLQVPLSMKHVLKNALKRMP
jgi:hypothetical protein